jgi:hypothetical protein
MASLRLPGLFEQTRNWLPLVSFNTSLNEYLVEPDQTGEESWKEIVIDDYHDIKNECEVPAAL